MSHVMVLSDEQYARLHAIADAQGETPEAALDQLLQTAQVMQTATAPQSQAPLAFIGMLSRPELAPEPGWLERHDEIIGGRE